MNNATSGRAWHGLRTRKQHADAGVTDLLLLHAPSVYDFRKHSILYGPVSDMVPSSTVFEMYPIGFLTIASYLHDRGYDVRIVNLALRMMNDPDFDVPAFLATVRPSAIGIDLHWLPHAHGALEVARLCKEVHPDVPVIMGGLSASYFHEELIRYRQVDFVLRGDSTEPPLHQWLRALRGDGAFVDVPNLTWKQGGEVRVNPHVFVPESLDYVDLRPDVVADMILRHRDVGSTLPLQGWLRNPMTAMLTLKGCAHDCVTCGASRTACTTLMRRRQPVFRSPASLVANMTAISRISRAPIYLVGDLLQAGRDAAREVLERLQRARLPNEIVFEFLDLPDEEFVRAIERHIRRWSLEISPESHDPALRQALDGSPSYDNARMEAVFDEALRRHCRRIDVFFMIGLPGQTLDSVGGTVDYIERLFRRTDPRLSCYVSPMGPFIDPGSRGFEEPERYGYRLFARTLEEHRRLLVQPTWEHILNYETRWMTRQQLVDATYDAAERLNALKYRYGRIRRRDADAVAARIAAARKLRARLEQAADAGESVSAELAGDINRFSVSTVCDKRELFGSRNFVGIRLAGLARLGFDLLGRRPTGARLPG